MRFQSLMQSLGTPLPEFSLADPAGRHYTPADFKAARGLLVAFICNHCPFVLHILDRFVAVSGEYAKRGIATLAISSNDVAAHPEDGPELMADLARTRGFGFPYLYDESQEAAIQFGAVCTPDFFLYGPDRRCTTGVNSTRVVRPRRTRPGVPEPARPPRDRPCAAMEALLAGRPSPAEQRPSMAAA
jgi:peroxiredoxin